MDKNRKTAYYVLIDIENRKAYSNIALGHHIRRGKPDAPAFVRELVYGVLRNRIYLDFIIGNFVKTPIDKMKKSDLTILRMGLYQLIYMNSVPEYAAVNESVELAKRFSRGHDGFINGVLRQYLRDKDYVKLPDRNKDEVRYLSLKYSYAPWIVEMWLDEYENHEFVEQLLEAGNQTPDFAIRVNKLKTNREDLMSRVIGKGYHVTLGKLAPMALHVTGADLLGGRLYRNGMFSVQDESSQLAVEMLDPQPGETIIDVCAAPGGKTLAIAERMGDKGKVHAWDIYKRKLAIVDREAHRLGISIVETNPWDATRINSAMVSKANRVLVDAPCTGLGVIRRKPEIKLKEESDDILTLPKKQLDILTASSQYVKPGGILVYSTCSVSKRENEKVVSDFLKKTHGFERVETKQLYPNVDKADGFFICKMKKSDSILEDLDNY